MGERRKKKETENEENKKYMKKNPETKLRKGDIKEGWKGGKRKGGRVSGGEKKKKNNRTKS